MAKPEDIIIRSKVDSDGISRVYSSHKINYESAKTLSEIVGTDDLNSYFSGEVKDFSEEAINRGYASTKTGYNRKVLASDKTTKDEIVNELNLAKVAHVVDTVSPSQEEKNIMESIDAHSIDDVRSAIDYVQALEDKEAGNITQKDFELGYNPHRGKKFDIAPGRNKSI